MSLLDARTVPADPTSRDRLAAQGLDYVVVDAADDGALDAVLRATARGFLDAEPPPEAFADYRERARARRTVGVVDPGSAQAGWPVGTIASWVTPLTVPGGELGMWAISDVTVAATHRRRGIARALLEGELRAAAAAGAPIAGLTVSEATIYGRYGFGPAVPVTRWSVETRRAGWVGPAPEGRVEYVDREVLAGALDEVHDRARRARAGEVAGWPQRWRQIAGLAPDDKEGGAVRGVRYLDAGGRLRGAMAYRITENAGDWTKSELVVRHLGAETSHAAAALWRFALQHDLVGTVTAELRPVDEPLPWLVADARAAVGRLRDHGWLRILDVERCLGARRYAAPLDVALGVSDPLGLCDGVWRVVAGEDGCAEVSRLAGGEPDLELGVAALSAAYLGGVSFTTLHDAGRVSGHPAVAAALDTAFRAHRAPSLSIWY